MSAVRVVQITVYPVKSMAGVDLESAVVEPRGLRDDRRLMVVDPHGECLTGREYPRLTQIRAAVGDGVLALSHAGSRALETPLQGPDERGEPVEIFGRPCTGVRVGAGVDAWLSEVIGARCHLVQMTRACPRPTEAGYSRPEDEVSYADNFPLLLTSTGSLADLNARLSEPVSMRRFRPNLVVDGCDAFAEDGWRELRVGEVTFEAAKRCDRCSFTTIDPETAERHPRSEPLRTLSTYRRTDAGVLFGQNLIPRSPGVVHVGDAVELLS